MGDWERVSSVKTAGGSSKKSLALSIRKCGVGQKELMVKSNLMVKATSGAEEDGGGGGHHRKFGREKKEGGFDWS